MTKEEAKERFGDNIINKLLSLGAEPTNVCRNDDIVEWRGDGCIKVGDIEVWAYYYFYEGFIETVVFILITGSWK